MASNQTPHYNLSQWLATDPVQRTDFNQDFSILDAALYSLSQNLLTKADSSSLEALSNTVTQLSNTVAQKANQSALSAVSAQIPKIAYGAYAGDGEYETGQSFSRTINLGFSPKVVLLINENGQMNNGAGSIFGGLAFQGQELLAYVDNGGGPVLTLTSSGFQVYTKKIHYSGGSYRYIASNESGYSYRYLAIG